MENENPSILAESKEAVDAFDEAAYFDASLGEHT
jgi:hypothetical protein